MLAPKTGGIQGPGVRGSFFAARDFLGVECLLVPGTLSKQVKRLNNSRSHLTHFDSIDMFHGLNLSNLWSRELFNVNFETGINTCK